MRDLFPKTPIVEVLNNQYDKDTKTIKKLLLFTPLTKEQHDRFSEELTRYLLFPKNSNKRIEIDIPFQKIYKFSLSDVVALGATDMETRLANKYMEYITIKVNDVDKKEYKCFINSDWRDPKSHIHYHDDGGCSWKCLMQKLKMPEYGIIYTINFDNKSKFHIND